jgi:hypothetical protein
LDPLSLKEAVAASAGGISAKQPQNKNNVPMWADAVGKEKFKRAS